MLTKFVYLCHYNLQKEHCRHTPNSVCYLFGTLKTWQFYKSTPDKSVNVRALRGCDFSVDRFAKTLSVDYDHPRFFCVLVDLRVCRFRCWKTYESAAYGQLEQSVADGQESP